MSPSCVRCTVSLFACLVIASIGTPASAQNVIPSRITLDDSAIRDQDDMCIWVHPINHSLSTVITSDKVANRIFVYDLAGLTVQSIPVSGQPGNIDIRYNFELDDELVDIVAFNDRTNDRIEVYRVDPETRQLSRVDDGTIATGPNYGICLYRSAISGNTYAFTTAENGAIEQFELRESNGQISGTRVRNWDIGGQTEGCVCDDETGKVYFGEEAEGIWKVEAEPSQPSTATAVATVGDASGLDADVEGLTIYYAAGGLGYLIASSQGSSEYKVYRRDPPHDYVRSFKVAGVSSTDGIDVANVSFTGRFPGGLFAVHNGGPSVKTVEVCLYADIGLMIDTLYWDPRRDLTDTEIALSDVQADRDRVRLSWYGPGAPAMVATVYRRTESTSWAQVGEAIADGTGRLRYEDAQVEPGRRYGYRLGIREAETERFVGEVWVDVPSGIQLALQGARPNPVQRHLVVSFSLPDNQPATLEMVDVAGRRVWSRRVEGLGPGNHLLNLGDQTNVPAGVYSIRLKQALRSLTSRVVVTR
jgi:3-phytase